MKINTLSDIIKELEHFKNEYGDVPVTKFYKSKPIDFNDESKLYHEFYYNVALAVKNQL